jgi:hypothetical protein
MMTSVQDTTELQNQGVQPSRKSGEWKTESHLAVAE